MEFVWRRSRTFGVITLLLTAAGIAMAVARPHAFINPSLGAEWQCSRTLFVVTCSRLLGGTAHRDACLGQSWS